MDMKNIIKITTLILTMAFFVNCQEDESEIGDIIAPSNLTISAEVLGVDAANPNGDGSGFVKLTASADNALSYSFQYGDGLEGVVPSGIDTHRYSIVGLNTYTVVVSAIGTGGAVAIALAIDGNGNGYTYDIVDDTFYSVDLSTGAATAIGGIGFDASFGQGMFYDQNSDQVFMVCLNAGAGNLGELRSVDLSTGATTLLENGILV